MASLLKAFLAAIALVVAVTGCSRPSGLLHSDLYETRQIQVITNEIVFTSFVETYVETNELVRTIRSMNGEE